MVGWKLLHEKSVNAVVANILALDDLAWAKYAELLNSFSYWFDGAMPMDRFSYMEIYVGDTPF